MFGLMTKAAHKEAIARAVSAKADRIAALEQELDLVAARLKRADENSNSLSQQLADTKARFEEHRAAKDTLIAELQERVVNNAADAEKWRAKVAKDKAYDATRRVRKSRVKKESAA